MMCVSPQIGRVFRSRRAVCWSCSRVNSWCCLDVTHKKQNCTPNREISHSRSLLYEPVPSPNRPLVWCDKKMVRGMRRWCFSCVGFSWSVSYCFWSCSSSRGVLALLYFSQLCVCLDLALSPILSAPRKSTQVQRIPEIHSWSSSLLFHVVVFSNQLSIWSGSIVLDTLGVLFSRILAVEIKACYLSGNAPTITSIAFGSRTVIF